MRRIYRRGALIAGGIAIAALPLLSTISRAADHADAPATKEDHAADITDVYAWHDDDKITVAVDFAGLSEAGVPADYDAEVLYTIHVDNNGDATSDFDILVRFGQNGAGDWGVQVVDLPGIADPVVGAVEQVIDAGLGLRVFAGLRDDPFFFDLDGFKMTVADGTLHFDMTRDTFAGTNIVTVMVEMSRDAVAGDGDNLAIWASTGRK
jgi:Domain of unknown function (DUF4331)